MREASVYVRRRANTCTTKIVRQRLFVKLRNTRRDRTQHPSSTMMMSRRSLSCVRGHGLLVRPSRTSRILLSTRSFSYEPLTKEEEEAEKERVKTLTNFQKEMELRDHDRQLAKLHMLRGINTGELYTLRGKFKMLARDYGIPFMVWYWTVWTTTALLSYGAMEFGGVDAIAVLAKVDGYTGFDLSSKVDPTVGTIGLTIIVNEMIEPIRLPIVVLSTKPVVNFFMPPKY